MQPSVHDVSFSDVSVVDHFVSNGRLIPIGCGGDYLDKLRSLRLLVSESVPVAVAKPQHEFVAVVYRQA